MKILAIDPSLVNLGYAYGEIVDGVLVVKRVGTFQPDKFISSTGWFDLPDITTSRQLAVEHFIKIALSAYTPIAISCESSFYNGRNPSTIINQSKGLGLIERLTRDYLHRSKSPFGLPLYQPNVIKRTLGVPKEDFKDKLAINKYIYKQIEDGNIRYDNPEDLPENQLDHGNDAVAMLYILMVNILKLDIVN